MALQAQVPGGPFVVQTTGGQEQIPAGPMLIETGAGNTANTSRFLLAS
jgi:hypothetical protein